MDEKKTIITVGEARYFYLKDPKANKRELAEKLLTETNLSIIEKRCTDTEKLAFENAAEAVRNNLRHLLSKGVAKKWHGIDMDETLFHLLVNFFVYLNDWRHFKIIF